MKGNTQDLYRKIASLESMVDVLETELTTLNELLVTTGFPDGIKTLKETALELIEEMKTERRPLS